MLGEGSDLLSSHHQTTMLGSTNDDPDEPGVGQVETCSLLFVELHTVDDGVRTIANI